MYCIRIFLTWTCRLMLEMNTYTWGYLLPSHTLVIPRSWQTYRGERRPKMISVTSEVQGRTQKFPLTSPSPGLAKFTIVIWHLWILKWKPTVIKISEYPQFINSKSMYFKLYMHEIQICEHWTFVIIYDC